MRPANLVGMQPMNTYLIGMRAVGKSTVGQLLAGKLGRPFIDMDHELVSEFKQSISDFVRANGWQDFRMQEEALLGRIAKLKGQVVATGGGVITADSNITLMRASGWVVWLKADPSTLVHRLNKDHHSSDMRPPIGEKTEAASELETLMQERQQAYRKAMHIAVDTQGRNLEMICRDIIDQSESVPAAKHTKG